MATSRRRVWFAARAAAAMCALAHGLARAQEAAPAEAAAPAPPPPAQAAPAPRPPPGAWYVGASALWASLASRHPSIDGASGAGLQIEFGARLAQGLVLDVRAGGFFDAAVGPTPEINYPADRAEYGFYQVGLVWEVEGGGAAASPWLGAWVGYHSVRWKTYWYSVSGMGLSLGAGAQFRLPLGLLRLGVTASLVDATSTYDAPAGGTTAVAVAGGWLVDWGRP